MQIQPTAGRTRDALRLRVHAGGRKPANTTPSHDGSEPLAIARTELGARQKPIELEPHIAAAIDLATD